MTPRYNIPKWFDISMVARLFIERKVRDGEFSRAASSGPALEPGRTFFCHTQQTDESRRGDKASANPVNTSPKTGEFSPLTTLTNILKG